MLPVPRDKEPDAPPPMNLSKKVKDGAKVGTGVAIGIGAYGAVKWGIAAFLAPETGGASLLGAGVAP